jgi:hypothetical protein
MLAALLRVTPTIFLGRCYILARAYTLPRLQIRDIATKKAQMRQRGLYAAVKLVHGHTSQNVSRTALSALLWRTPLQQIHRVVVSITEVLTSRQAVIFT